MYTCVYQCLSFCSSILTNIFICISLCQFRKISLSVSLSLSLSLSPKHKLRPVKNVWVGVKIVIHFAGRTGWHALSVLMLRCVLQRAWRSLSKAERRETDGLGRCLWATNTLWPGTNTLIGIVAFDESKNLENQWVGPTYKKKEIQNEISISVPARPIEKYCLGGW